VVWARGIGQGAGALNQALGPENIGGAAMGMLGRSLEDRFPAERFDPYKQGVPDARQHEERSDPERSRGAVGARHGWRTADSRTSGLPQRQGHASSGWAGPQVWRTRRRKPLGVQPSAVGGALRNLSIDEAVSQPTLLGRGMQALGNIPGVKGLTDVISQRVMQQPGTNAWYLNGYYKVRANIENIQQSAMSQVAAVGRAPVVDDAGKMTLTDGSPAFAHDVFQSPLKYASKLDPQTFSLIQKGHEVYDVAIQQTRDKFAQLEAVAPDVAKNFAGLMKEADLGGAEHFWPRYAKTADGELLKAWRPRPGARSAGDFEREYLTEEKARAGGIQYDTPLEDLRHRLFDLYDAQGQMDLAQKLVGTAEHVTDTSAIQQAGEELAARRGDVQQLRQVQDVLARVARGETIPETNPRGIARQVPDHRERDRRGDESESGPTQNGIPWHQ
jgi:hypothetical protein